MPEPEEQKMPIAFEVKNIPKALAKKGQAFDGIDDLPPEVYTILI